MTKPGIAVAALLASMLLSAGVAHADQLLGSYVARISEKDHLASDGYVLDSAAQVVRQDRARASARKSDSIFGKHDAQMQ